MEGSLIAIIGTIAAVGAAVGLVWFAFKTSEKYGREKQRREESEATGEARERYDEEFGRSRGGALARAREWLQKHAPR